LSPPLAFPHNAGKLGIEPKIFCFAEHGVQLSLYFQGTYIIYLYMFQKSRTFNYFLFPEETASSDTRVIVAASPCAWNAL